jgi:hypothetical protein
VFPLQNFSKGDLSDLMMMHPRCEQNARHRAVLIRRGKRSSGSHIQLLRQCRKANAIVYGILLGKMARKMEKYTINYLEIHGPIIFTHQSVLDGEVNLQMI